MNQFNRLRYYRDTSYRKRMMRCLGASCLFFLIAGHYGPQKLIPEAFRSDEMAVLGENKIADDLITSDLRIQKIYEFAAHRIAEGAMQCVEYVIEDEITGIEGPNPRPSVHIGEIVLLTPPAVAHEKPATPPPTIELDFNLNENQDLQDSAVESSHSSEFGIIEMFKPEYPDESLDSYTQGLIVFRIVVNPSGSVDSVEMLENHTDRHCEIASRMALREWVFKPIKVDGSPVWFSVTVPFRFEIIGG